jgi:hypothetical protein
MLDEAFQSSTDAALIDMAQRPQRPKPQAPAFSLWATMKAAPKGVVAGAAQGMASTAEMTSAFGDVLGSLGDAGGQGMFGGLTAKERQETNAAREKLITTGPEFTSEGGRMLRDSARYYLPDPVTAHWSEHAVGNLVRFGSKALTAALTLGNVPGAIVAGAEEGFTQAEDLRTQGVDLATRTKVGAVTAATNAVGFALPVAGQTWRATLGLAAVGGPGSFVVQNAATRQILQDANYSDLATQFDPFDPVGLALSTLLPLGFGALAMRGSRVKTKVDADAVDAARVDFTRELTESSRAAPPDDLAAAAAHNTALARSMDQIADGSRVDVSDVAPAAARITEEVDGRLRTVARAFDEVAPAEKAPTKAEMTAKLDEATAKAAEPTKPLPPKDADAGKGELPELDRAAVDLEARMPDLEVRLDGMDAPAKVSDLMAQVREQAKVETAEASLVEAAAHCFLRTLAG